MKNRNLTKKEMKYGIRWVRCANCFTWHRVQCVSELLEPYFCSKKCENNYFKGKIR